jgi:hypothetical protein
MPSPTAGQALQARSSVGDSSVLLSRVADGGQRRAAKQARSKDADRKFGGGCRLRRDAHPPGNPTDQRGRRAERPFIFAQNIIASKLGVSIARRPRPRRTPGQMALTPCAARVNVAALHYDTRAMDVPHTPCPDLPRIATRLSVLPPNPRRTGHTRS